jgi:hypothetical protein
MKVSVLTMATSIFLIALHSLAFAQVTCSHSGPGPDPVDPTLAPRIVAWVTKVEKKFGLSAANWHGEPATVANREQAEALELQALTADWEDAAPPGTVEATFRAAVGHGVAAQTELTMMRVDPANAKQHRFWSDTEAARAVACLSLIQLPQRPDK